MTDLDDTVTAPPRPLAVPSWDASPDLAETVIVSGAAAPLTPRGASAVTRAPTVDPPRIAGFYRFRLGWSGEAIELDVPCYLGRRPSLPRIRPGEAPRLIRVPSPLKEVSATHLELRQRGSSVIVTDLRSTNGSVVLVPGSVPRKLRQGESVVVSPGTLVDIGDDNILQILPAQGLE